MLILKLLVLLFLSILGYDTINLYIQNSFTQQSASEPAICSVSDAYHHYQYYLENHVLKGSNYVWLSCVPVLFMAIYFVRKWRKDQDHRISEILLQLSSLTRTDHKLTQHANNLVEDIFCNIIEQGDCSAIDPKCTQLVNNYNSAAYINESIVEDSVPDVSSIAYHDAPYGLSQTESLDLFENISRGSPSDQRHPSMSNNVGRKSLIKYPGLNKSTRFLFNDRTLPMSFILPKFEQEALNKCECKVTEFEERLVEVENGMKKTHQITVLWKARIEQTEEELLELQQQMHCLVLDWSFKTAGTKYFQEKGGANSTENIFPEFVGYKPLQIISEIIEDTKRQVFEEEHRQMEKTAADGVQYSIEFEDTDVKLLEHLDVSRISENNGKISENTAINKKGDDDAHPSEDNVPHDKGDAPLPTTKNTIDEDDAKQQQDNPVDKNNLLFVEHDWNPMPSQPLATHRYGRFRYVLPTVPSHIVSPRRPTVSKRNRPQPRCAYSLRTICEP